MTDAVDDVEVVDVEDVEDAAAAMALVPVAAATCVEAGVDAAGAAVDVAGVGGANMRMKAVKLTMSPRSPMPGFRYWYC